MKEKLSLSSLAEKLDLPHHAFSWASWLPSTLEILIAFLAKESKPQSSNFFFSGLCSELSRAHSEFSWVLLVSSKVYVVRAHFYVLGDRDSDEGMKEPKPVPQSILLLEVALTQERHNLWELVLKIFIKEVICVNFSSLSSFLSLYTVCKIQYLVLNE